MVDPRPRRHVEVSKDLGPLKDNPTQSTARADKRISIPA